MIPSIIELQSGLCLTLSDESRHYFGGYYHVRITARCDVAIVSDYFESDPEFCSAQALLGPVVSFVRILEKMAVPESDVSAVQCQLIDAFNSTARRYLESSGFARGFVRSEYRKCTAKALNYQASRA